MQPEHSALPAKSIEESLLSIVVPAYNEAEVLALFHARMTATLATLPMAYELWFVNDGSRDATLAVLQALRAQDDRVGIVDLSRNFGKEIAMTAGLEHARGDAVVVIDADLQDPPELIHTFIEHWQQGSDVVYAKRRVREGETWLKKATASAFYRFMKHVGRVRIPEDTGDYRLMSRRAVDSLLKLREHHRFMKGLFAWIGYTQTPVLYNRDPRAEGNTKFNYLKLWNFALTGVTSFTTFPLKLATYLGLLVAAFAFAFGGYLIVKTILYGDPVAGYPSLMTAVLMLGGVQLIALGVLGEYIGRMFDEVKGRPLYLTQRVVTPEVKPPQADRPV